MPRQIPPARKRSKVFPNEPQQFRCFKAEDVLAELQAKKQSSTKEVANG